MRLCVLTPPCSVPREASLLASLVAVGATAVHVRKPGATRRETAAYLSSLPPPVLAAAVLHAPHDLAPEFGVQVGGGRGNGGLSGARSPRSHPPSLLQGLHLTEAARAAAPPTRTQGLTLSASLHSLADVPQRVGQENNRCPFDYVFLSPIFDSISKTGYPAASFDEEALVQTLAGAACDVVALGGLDARTALSAARTGFAGAALLGCLWGPSVDDPVTELRAVRAAFGA